MILTDGTFEPADIVVFATGYHFKFDFIDKKILDKMEYDTDDALQPLIMYKAKFHPDIANFVCIGMIKEPGYPVIELQGRLASLVFSGKIKLPPRDVMIEGMNKEREFRTMEKKPQKPRFEILAIYADELAKQINVMPDLKLLKKQSLVYTKLFGKVLFVVFILNLLKIKILLFQFQVKLMKF